MLRNRRRSSRATSNYSSKSRLSEEQALPQRHPGGEEWATTVGGYVDTAEYGAKGTHRNTVAVGSAKQWATKDMPQ